MARKKYYRNNDEDFFCRFNSTVCFWTNLFFYNKILANRISNFIHCIIIFFNYIYY